MKSLPGSTADANRHLSSYRVVWYAEVDADEPNEATTTQFYAHRAYALHTLTYQDLFASWPEFGWAKIRLGGGLAQVSTLSLSLRNEEKEHQLIDTFFLENDVVRAGVVFASGSETITDRIEMYRGVVENLPFGIRTWDLDVIDGSDKDFREVPQAKVNLIDYVDASFDALGKVVPEAFGSMNVGPYDDAGAEPLMVPCRNTNIFTQEYTPGLRCNTYDTVAYQYYPTAKRYAEVSNITESGGLFTVDDGQRIMRLGGVLAAGTNDVAGFKAVMDGNDSNGVAIVNTDNLDILIGGVSKLGTLTQLDLVIRASGGYDYDLLLDAASQVGGPQSDTGNIVVNIAGGPTTHADDWDFERYTVQIDGTGAATINQIFLKLTYDDQQSQDRQELALFMKVTGWDDLAANYADGGQIAGGGGLANAADMLEAFLRGGNLTGLLEASINQTAFDAAVIARNGWNVGFALGTPVSIDWINEFGFQMAMHVFKDFAGQWKVIAQEKTTAPVHTFLAHNIAIKNPGARVEQFEPDVAYSRTPVRDLINEIALRYKLDRGPGEYAGVLIKSGRTRLTGTCSVVASTSKLTDSGGGFSGIVQPNDTVYVEGDKDYNVDAVDSDTVLSISVTVGSVRDSVAGTNYFLGPNLDGRLVRSQQRYKTETALGKRQTSITEVGGYTSDIIIDDTTAANVVEHLIEWRSQRRLQVEYATFLNAVDVELGDFAWFDHAWLPQSKRPVLVGTITAGVNASVTTFDSGENGQLRVNDVIYLDSEVVHVVTVSYSGTEFVVTRGQDNTVAAAHSNGASFFRLNFVRWEIVSHKPVPSKQQIRLQIQETPPGYQPVGIVQVAGFPAWDAATGTQRTQSGWVALFSGRVKDEDEYSAVSFVGPDQGVYVF